MRSKVTLRNKSIDNAGIPSCKYSNSVFISPQKFPIIELSRQFPFLDILCIMP